MKRTTSCLHCGSFPDEEAASRQAPGANQAVLHLDVFDVKELMRGKLGQECMPSFAMR